MTKLLLGIFFFYIIIKYFKKNKINTDDEIIEAEYEEIE